LAVAMENVPLAGQMPQFWAMVARMERAGYQWTAGIVNAALYGSAQCRQRLVFIALRKDVRAEPIFPRPSHGGNRRYFSYQDGSMKGLDGDWNGMLGEAPATQRIRRMLPWDDRTLGRRCIPYVEEVLDGLPRIGSRAADRLCHRPWAHTRDQFERMGAVPEGGRWPGGREHFASSYGRLHRRGLARTITRYFANPGSGRFWHPAENRALSLREAARIQGFPDSFDFLPPYSWAADLVGNALDISIAIGTYEAIRAALE
jgi:DNA (cytosine-5)-methyltransferase 1